MAALGKIRSRGVILICIIGFGLFAFIAEEAFRSCDSSRNESKQQLGEVLGEKINAQDFQKIVEEYTEASKMMYQKDNLTDDEQTQIKDQAWNDYVSNKIIANECSKVGLTVTDQEVQNVISQGTNQILQRVPYFMNQQTGRFDANALKKFLAEYDKAKSSNPQMAEQYEKIYNYWIFIEKTLRQSLLSQKYQALLASCVLSNPVEAKMTFKDENEESNIQLAYMDYNSVNDKQIKITEGDMKDKYNELKESWRIKHPVETRDVKFVSYKVVASPTDRSALQKTFADYAKQLQASADPTDIVRKSQSLIPYLGIPVSKNAFPQDIAGRLDSIATGTVVGPVENKQDNTLNLYRLISKTQLPDSVQFRVISVNGATPDAARKSADSIYTAIKAGGDFEAIAKKYGQTGEKTWMTTAQYEHAQSMDNDNRKIFNAMNTMATNDIQNISMANGNIIIQVLDRKGMITKYDAAVIKKTIDFSKDTYAKAYNKFSQFVSSNQSLAAMQKNAAKFGFKVQDHNNITTAEHYIGGVHGTREAMKWLFQADEGQVSPLYECGDNDNLMVVVLTKINPKGYLPLDNPQVKEMVRQAVMRDKKAEFIMAKLKGVNSIAAAQQKGCKVVAVNQVTFAAPTFVQAIQATEPAISGAVSATAVGKFVSHPVKGNSGVYLFQVLSKTMRPVKFDEKTYVQKSIQQGQQMIFSTIMNELVLKANVVDNRYMFL